MIPDWEPHMPAKDAVMAIGKIMHDSRYWYRDDPNPRNPLTEEERWVAFDDVYEALKKAQERLLDATRSVFRPGKTEILYGGKQGEGREHALGGSPDKEQKE